MDNQNREVTRELQKELGLSELTGYPRKIADAILPVVNINPKKFISVVKTLDADGPIYTAPADKDFYFIGYSVVAASAAASVSRIDLTINGETITGGAGYLSITAGQGASNLSFTNPIKIDRATALQLTSNADDILATIYGYEEDVTGA